MKSKSEVAKAPEKKFDPDFVRTGKALGSFSKPAYKRLETLEKLRAAQPNQVS